MHEQDQYISNAVNTNKQINNAMLNTMAGTKAIVIGAGRSGMAATRLLLARGVRVSLLEKDIKKINAEFKAEIEQAHVEIIIGDFHSAHFANVDYIIPSPGVPVSQIIPHLPKENKPEILAEMELGWRFLDGEPCLAITGTSGKTTTASLAAAMLKAHGLSVFLGGNIGTPLCEYVLEQKKVQVLVLEVSSFQLQTCSSFAPHVAILLNITENHLDYHEDMQEYITAKLSMFVKQKSNDIAIIHKSLARVMNDYTLQAKTLWIEQDRSVKNIIKNSKLSGEHNAENIAAAWFACNQFGVSEQSASIAVKNFAPLAHRLESVRKFNDVLYVNDSKCTTTSSLKVALEAFDSPIVLLCGGKYKGGDLQGLRNLITKKVQHVALFGASREYFEKAWSDIVSITWSPTLDLALNEANLHAKDNHVVLLAPATASYDLYTNYMARGDHFKRLVGALQ